MAGAQLCSGYLYIMEMTVLGIGIGVIWRKVGNHPMLILFYLFIDGVSIGVFWLLFFWDWGDLAESGKSPHVDIIVFVH